MKQAFGHPIEVMMRPRLLVIVGLAVIALVAIAIFSPRIAAGGWLLALVMVSAVPLGSLALLMIHRITGGRWGGALSPLFDAASHRIPWLALLFIPTLFALPILYPWATHSADVAPSVERFYLNQPLFIARSVIAFAGWSTLALLLPRSGVVLSALGLVFYAVAISFVSIDWILSIEPAFISTSFGATMAVSQMLAALAFAALAAPADLHDRVRSDLGGLILAFSLGATYLNFMAVLVVWYGDLPDRVFWFTERIRQPWLSIAVASFVFGSLIPILCLLPAHVRRSRTGLRYVSTSSLAGLMFYAVWLIAPAYGVETLATALPAGIVMICGLVAAPAARWPRVFNRAGASP
jgi:hypothetical protein